MDNIEDLRKADIGDVVEIENDGIKLKVKVLGASPNMFNPCLCCALFEQCIDSSVCTLLGRQDGKEVYF